MPRRTLPISLFLIRFWPAGEWGYDTLMWQTPILGLTAQAFLFSVALNPSCSVRTARLISMILAQLATSLMSIQLMAKHRHHEMVDSLTLEQIEKDHSLTGLHLPIHHRQIAKTLKRPWLLKLSSYRVWMVGLALFAVAALFIIVVSIARPDILSATATAGAQAATISSQPNSQQQPPTAGK